MKKIYFVAAALISLLVIFAIVFALQTGERSPLYLAGEVVLEESLVADAQGIEDLFIILYDDSVNVRQPFGAIRYPISEINGGSILKFNITPDNLQQMFPGRVAPDEFRVKVRLDKDGMAGPDQEGDLVGEQTTVKYGSRDVELVINKKISFQ